MNAKLCVGRYPVYDVIEVFFTGRIIYGVRILDIKGLSQEFGVSHLFGYKSLFVSMSNINYHLPFYILHSALRLASNMQYFVGQKVRQHRTIALKILCQYFPY